MRGTEPRTQPIIMEILFACKKCACNLAVDEAGADGVIECPKCGSEIKVPKPTSCFACPACRRELCAPHALVGDKLSCPECDHPVAVPHLRKKTPTVRPQQPFRIVPEETFSVDPTIEELEARLSPKKKAFLAEVDEGLKGDPGRMEKLYGGGLTCGDLGMADQIIGTFTVIGEGTRISDNVDIDRLAGLIVYQIGNWGAVYQARKKYEAVSWWKRRGEFPLFDWDLEWCEGKVIDPEQRIFERFGTRDAWGCQEAIILGSIVMYKLVARANGETVEKPYKSRLVYLDPGQFYFLYTTVNPMLTRLVHQAVVASHSP